MMFLRTSIALVSLLASVALCDSAVNPSTCACPISSTSPTSSAIPGSSSSLSNVTKASPPSSAHTVASTILVLAKDSGSAYNGYSGLEGYGIPYQVLIVPQGGATLPQLNSSSTQGNFGGIIILSELSYQYSTGYASALTNDQFNQLYAYQTAFGVRMVRIDCYPQSMYGTTTAISGQGCCGNNVEQLVSFSNNSGFSTANIKLGAGITTQNIYHYPATITDTAGSTVEIAQFAPDSANQFTTKTTAAVINNFNGRQQMVWFIGWATQWSPTSNYLQHAHIHWLTRGIFTGARKTYLNTQVDDVHLKTLLYTPANTTFRLRPADLDNHVSWMKGINSRLPAGSNYFTELGHNGNGDITAATQNDTQGICNPETAIYYIANPDTPLEYQKPLGSGTSVWPTTPSSYVWSAACQSLDPLAAWFTVQSNRDAFAHISHTFTHESLDNATYSDASHEIVFNQAWLKNMGIAAGKFSPAGLIPPAITGMHNGDVIKAWLDNGITAVVGDNSRPVLTNTDQPWWPLMSNVAVNGYAGLVIMPRWATRIYFNCDTADCTTAEWNASGGSGTFTDLINNERFTGSRYLLSLRQDAFMFHQANLRNSDASSTTVGSQTGQFSLIQTWVETVTQEMTRLTNWPILSKKHDDMAVLFTQRVTRDNCHPSVAWKYSLDGTQITGATLTTDNNQCGAPVPVTLPGPAVVTAPGGSMTVDQTGSEPEIHWVNMMGMPVVFQLMKPVAV